MPFTISISRPSLARTTGNRNVKQPGPLGFRQPNCRYARDSPRIQAPCKSIFNPESVDQFQRPRRALQLLRRRGAYPKPRRSSIPTMPRRSIPRARAKHIVGLIGGRSAYPTTRQDKMLAKYGQGPGGRGSSGPHIPGLNRADRLRRGSFTQMGLRWPHRAPEVCVVERVQ
jgi:hypothetical protein